jgi:hypothetical protein
MKALVLAPVFALGLSVLAFTPATAAPTSPTPAVQTTAESNATKVEWRYRYRHHHRERYWYGGRAVRHMLRRL